MLDSVKLEVPLYLTEERANQISGELIDQEETLMTKFPVKARKNKKNV